MSKKALLEMQNMVTRSHAVIKDNYLRSPDERLSLIRQYGSHSLAYATLQRYAHGEQLLQYYDTNEGYIAYSNSYVLGRRTIVLGEPICAARDVAKLLKSFISVHPNSVFLQVGEIVACQLESFGFLVNRFGTETFLDVETFSLTGTNHEDIRAQLNRATRDGVTIVTQINAENSINEIKQVSREWMQSRVIKTHELRFMVRPAIHMTEPFVRKLYAYVKGKLVGFAYYDPIFRDGSIIGYHAMTNRFSTSAPRGTSYLLDITMVRTLKQEGISLFALGFAPFSAVNEKEPFRHSWIAKQSFSLSYEYLNSLYNFKGQELRKRKYCGRKVPLFFASRGRVLRPLLGLLAACRACDFSVYTQIMQSIGLG